MSDNERDDAVQVEQQRSKKRKYRRDKPWDTDDIDHWDQPKWQEEDMKGERLF